MAKNLDLSAAEVRVGCAFRAATNPTGHPQAKFITNPFRGGKDRLAVRVTNHLDDAFAITQINKDHAAMIAPTLDPAKQRDGLIQMLGRNSTGIAGAAERRCAHGRQLGKKVRSVRSARPRRKFDARRHNPHGNDILECFIDTHVEFDHIRHWHHQEKTRSRVRRRWYINRHHAIAGPTGNFGRRDARLKGNCPTASARILDQKSLPKSLPTVRK